ncbi:long-chain fatty acid--CoA ligase [Ectothiorhodospiraceae bacterium WFHF3C12]|nr:long-chain fatty acid--CoA ligase [Ectothiorhodospiraceae bacterium WFHF3C12]
MDIATDLLDKQAQLRPNDTALVDDTAGRELTYAELDQRASAMARALREELGLSAGDRVAMLAQNSAEFFELLFACAKAELILVPLNWRLAVPELTYVLEDCEARAIVFEDMFAEQVSALRKTFADLVPVRLGESHDAGEQSFESLIAGNPGRYVMPERMLGDTWYVLYTSGTTGKPKGVVQTFGMAVFNHLNIGVPQDLTARDTMLNVLPFFHTGGINLLAMPTLIVGGTVIIVKTFDPPRVLELLRDRASVFFGVPAIYQVLIDHPDFDGEALSGVREWACGGAPMPYSVLKRYADAGIHIRQGFGMTETGPTVFLMGRERLLEKLGSVGLPQQYALARVVDEKGNDLPDDTVGELWVKGPAITPGYWRQPEKTAEAITPDGWLRTGDLARCDADGYFYIVDRSKDMFISGGENVYPAEVENVLYNHPGVAEAAVIGVPDERWGEVGLAVIVARPGVDVTAEALREHCQGQLARYKIPARFEFTDALPRNAGGKVVKPQLREQYIP